MATVAAQRTTAYRDQAMPGSPTGTFELLRRWNEYLKVSSRCGETTRHQYRRALIGFLADTLLELHDVTEDDVVSFLASKSPQGGAHGYYIRALHSFYRWAERRGVIADNPVGAIDVPREKYRDAPSLEEQDRLALFAAAERIDPRARPAMELMYATGARIGSLCGVRAEDTFVAKSGKRWIRFEIAKGDRPYAVPLGPLGERAFDRLLELDGYRAPHSGPRLDTLVGVRPGGLRAWVTRASEIAGVHAWPHLLRHAYAYELEEVSDRTFAALMNHRDASLRRRYAKQKDGAMEAASEVFV